MFVKCIQDLLNNEALRVRATSLEDGWVDEVGLKQDAV